MVDLGDGTCRALTSIFANETGDCTQNIFNSKTCQNLDADLFLIAANPKNLSGSVYKTHDFQKHFTALGIGGIVASRASPLL